MHIIHATLDLLPALAFPPLPPPSRDAAAISSGSICSGYDGINSRAKRDGQGAEGDRPIRSSDDEEEEEEEEEEDSDDDAEDRLQEEEEESEEEEEEGEKEEKEEEEARGKSTSRLCG